jgi:hypothetical protein
LSTSLKLSSPPQEGEGGFELLIFVMEYIFKNHYSPTTCSSSCAKKKTKGEAHNKGDYL